MYPPFKLYVKRHPQGRWRNDSKNMQPQVILISLKCSKQQTPPFRYTQLYVTLYVLKIKRDSNKQFGQIAGIIITRLFNR